jgi:hypothetical protein
VTGCRGSTGIDIGADCVVVAAMLEALLPAFVAMRAQALQLASLEFHRIVVMRLDVVCLRLSTLHSGSFCS